MGEFYDLNEYLAVGVRKWKWIIIFVIIFAFSFGTIRGIDSPEGALLNMFKGTIWGGLTGFMVAMVYVYGVYVSGMYVNNSQDLNTLEVPLFGIYRKKGRLKVYSRVLERLEGNISTFYELSDLAKVVGNVILKERIPVVISGCISSEKITELIFEINKQLGKRILFQVKWIDSPLISPYDLGQNQQSGVILVEEFHKSSKKKIKSELLQFEINDIKVLGIVGIE